MKIYVKNVEGLTLPKRGSDVAAGYDIVAASDAKIVGTPVHVSTDITYASEPIIPGKEPWRNIDYIEYETNLFIGPETPNIHTLIYPRSSISKYNLVLANSIGLVDNDYRGMILCRFKYIWQPNDMWWGGDPNKEKIQKRIFATVNFDKIYKKGDKIAQLVFNATTDVHFEVVDDLLATNRGTGGFGSTDSKIHPKPALGRTSITQLYQESGGIEIKSKYDEELQKLQN